MKIQSTLKQGLIAGSISATINLVIFFIAKAVGVINDSALLPSGQTLRLAPVIMSSLIPALLASLILFGLTKISKKPKRVFTIIAAVVLFFSTIGLLWIPQISGSMITILIIMHLVVGITIIYFLNKATTATN